MKFPRATSIQSILFDRDRWTVSEAKRWLEDHDKKIPSVDRTTDYYRFRQAPPGNFDRSTFRTISLGKNIKAVIAMPLKKNPSSKKVRLPRKVVDLGRLVELTFADGTVWSPRKKLVHLCSSESGRTLWILTVSKENTKKQPRSRLYRDFTGYYSSGVRTAQVSEPSSLKKSGRVQSVVYSSKKWDGRMREYIHTFRHHPVAHADNLKHPTFVKISGSRIRVQKRGITG